MTYEEKLKKTAEELYNMSPDVKCFRWEGCAIQHNDVEAFIQLAAYCLKKQAEAYRMGILMYGGSAKHPECEINSELKQLGLIP